MCVLVPFYSGTDMCDTFQFRILFVNFSTLALPLLPLVRLRFILGVNVNLFYFQLELLLPPFNAISTTVLLATATTDVAAAAAVVN